MSARVRVSVVIPAYRSGRQIAACLDALGKQDFRDFKTIVVNSSPGDGTAAAVRARAPGATYLESPMRLLPHAARNAGAARARGSLFAFTDPDCVPAADWLSRLVNAYEEHGGVVQGSMALAGGGWRETGIHLCKWHHLLPGLPPGPVWTMATGNCLYPRAAWEAAGPFEGNLFCGDALLAWRAAAHGFPLVFEPRAVVAQRHRQAARVLLRERFSRGAEFGKERARHEGWGRTATAARLLGAPAVLAAVVIRSLRHALADGRGAAWIATLPLHAAGQAAWIAGEARACLSLLLNGGPEAAGKEEGKLREPA